jgi:hypothetical protein
MSKDLQYPIELPQMARAFLAKAPTLRNPALGIFVLSEPESVGATAAVRRFGIGETLGLVVLDDANDSNPFCLISRGVAGGMVLHLMHDGDPQITFASLDSFEQALLAAIASRTHVMDLLGPPILPISDQSSLEQAMMVLIEDEADQDAEFLLCLYLPLLLPTSGLVLSRLAQHSSFFVREAVAEFVESHALPEHLEIAQNLSKDPHPQVQRPGKRALSSVNRARFAKPGGA